MCSKNYNYNDRSAKNYDTLVRKSESHAHEIMFGLLFEYIKEGDNLLDLGIGTGLVSALFHKLGLRIFGVDISEAMLNICRKKGIAEDLKRFDLNARLPYDEKKFDHIISVGVFHFFKDLKHLFKESKRLLRADGTFSFTVLYPKDDSIDISEEIIDNFTVYLHSQHYVEKLVKKFNFKLLKKLKFQSYTNPSKKQEITNKIFILRK